jgi:Mn-dependent DtxR family transcriptional regulator
MRKLEAAGMVELKDRKWHLTQKGEEAYAATYDAFARERFTRDENGLIRLNEKVKFAINVE